MSSETKWTPGPWVLSYDKGMGRDVVASPDPKPICTIKQSWVTREQYAANAQLIASAPKLYEALAALTDWHEWSLECSERMAEEFRRETGMMAPFKDCCAVANMAEELHASRAETWRAWCKQRNASLIAAARAALTSARGEG